MKNLLLLLAPTAAFADTLTPLSIPVPIQVGLPVWAQALLGTLVTGLLAAIVSLLVFIYLDNRKTNKEALEKQELVNTKAIDKIEKQHAETIKELREQHVKALSEQATAHREGKAEQAKAHKEDILRLESDIKECRGKVHELETRGGPLIERVLAGMDDMKKSMDALKDLVQGHLPTKDEVTALRTRVHDLAGEIQRIKIAQAKAGVE